MLAFLETDWFTDCQTFLKVGTHPTIDMLPDRYTTYEEAYNFLTPPTGVNATVLLTPDGTSYSDPEYVTRGSYQGSIHPSAWYREEAVSLANGSTTAAIGGTMTGRLWYTSLVSLTNGSATGYSKADNFGIIAGSHHRDLAN